MHYCNKCGRTLKDTEFYLSKNIEKYPPDGRLHTCKKCLTMHVDNWDPSTYLPILEEADVPYIPDVWNDLLEKWLQKNKPEKITGLSILGKYLSVMKLKQHKDYYWADTEALAKKKQQETIFQMRAQGMTEDEIEESLSVDRRPKRPNIPVAATSPESNSISIDGNVEEGFFEPVVDEFEDQLTEEDKVRLRLKWGSAYRPYEWVRLEQLYQDMMNSYDIQTAGHKDTLIMICKTSLKANQLIDAGNIDEFQKMSKVYDTLMKSGRFTAVQNKDEYSESLDSVGELVALCEKEGFIPRYYVDKPNDQVDRTLQDMQNYTKTLVTEELNLGNMLESAIRDIEADRAREAIIQTDDTETDEDSRLADMLFEEKESITTDKDFEEFEEFKQKERKIDQRGGK